METLKGIIVIIGFAYLFGYGIFIAAQEIKPYWEKYSKLIRLKKKHETVQRSERKRKD